MRGRVSSLMRRGAGLLGRLAKLGKRVRPAEPFDERLLEVLACPATRTRLRYDRAAQELIADQAGLAYPIVDGIPVLLASEARPLTAGPEPRAGRR